MSTEQRPVAVITSDGTTVRIDDGHRGLNRGAMEEAERLAVMSGTHLWIMTTAHAITANALDRMDSDPLIADAESLLGTAIGCFVCEQPWEPRLTRRRCKGEPGRSVKR
jgi:hypothetical protein